LVRFDETKVFLSINLNASNFTNENTGEKRRTLLKKKNDFGGRGGNENAHKTFVSLQRFYNFPASVLQGSEESNDGNVYKEKGAGKQFGKSERDKIVGLMLHHSQNENKISCSTNTRGKSRGKSDHF